MDKNSKDVQKPLVSEANASRPAKPVFSPDCGPLSESEIALLKQLARQTAREVSGPDSGEGPTPDHQNSKGRDPIIDEIQRLPCRRVNPMSVLKNHQHWLS